ncbi:MAG: glutathione S-transferase family protein [Thermosynechococcaceae cyanobacterium]
MALPPAIIIGTGRWVWSSMWHLMMSRLAPRNTAGEYQRPASTFRHWIGAEDGAQFPPETGRYILIVGDGCPWAHRTLVTRALKGLEAAIAVIRVAPDVNVGGWKFEQPFAGCSWLSELYLKSQANYKGRSTVPVLWDCQTQTIVNNESADIIVMLNAGFNAWATRSEWDLYPEDLREIIDQWNDQIYRTVNNGVYRCGFAQTQAAYELACREVFQTLDELDQVLGQQRYICGNQVTLADVRLFTTLFRFDAVYFGLFKCNLRQIRNYPHLGPYLRDLYQLPGVAETCNLVAIKRDYYGNLFPLNPGQIIPLGPDEMDLVAPHDRDRLGRSSVISR